MTCTSSGRGVIRLRRGFWGAGATVEAVKAKVGNDMNSHERHGDLVADAGAPSA
jgi:hypothetical protein